jgi:hypothetical protein
LKTKKTLSAAETITENPTNGIQLKPVRSFSVAIVQILAKGLVELLAEVGAAGEGQGEAEAQAAEHAGKSIACPRAAMYVHDR